MHNTARRFRPEELKLKDAGRALRLRLPENELIKEFYERYPEVGGRGAMSV